MTQGKDKVLEVPQANYPICTRVYASCPFPPDLPVANPQTGITPTPLPVDYFKPVLWEFGKPHPLVPDMLIVRMYVEPGVSVEVYSSSKDGKTGARHTIPWQLVKIAEEMMDAATFVGEIAAAEDELGGGGEPETTNGNGKPTAAVVANGGA